MGSAGARGEARCTGDKGTEGGAIQEGIRDGLRPPRQVRYPMEREIKQRLQRIFDQQRRAHLDEDDAAEEGGDNEEQQREVLLLSIDLATIKALDQRTLLQQEVAMLSHIAALPPEQRARPSGPDQAQLMPKLLAAAGQLQAQRERVAGAVFRPTHHLPTMSLDEFADGEVADMQRRQQAEQEAAAAKASKGEESDGDDEEGVRKARAWDDWKDDNPRGWGNSKLRPTA